MSRIVYGRLWAPAMASGLLAATCGGWVENALFMASGAMWALWVVSDALAPDHAERKDPAHAS